MNLRHDNEHVLESLAVLASIIRESDPKASKLMRSLPQFLQVPVNQRYRQPDHVEVAALYPIDELGREALNRVSAGLVHRFAARYVLGDIFVGEF
jgi:hypothetical protein